MEKLFQRGILLLCNIFQEYWLRIVNHKSLIFEFFTYISFYISGEQSMKQND